jgi:nickel/cobalt transporter (NiCoT) family protein
MESLPSSWPALCALAFVLGMRHGFDADHLATIDGITRCNRVLRPRLARYAGALFSLGHGLVVVMIAAAAGMATSERHPPAWLEITGVTVSLLFLFGLAFVNLRAVAIAKPCEVVRPTGFRGRLLGRVLTVQRPWAVATVGAFFAVSFDTVSQAALMSLAAERFGGPAHSLFVAMLFVAGMLAVDGANGAVLAKLVRNADRTAVVASRTMALGVGALSTAVGLFTLAKLVLPGLDAWADRQLAWGGAGIVVAVLVAFPVAMAAARRARAPCMADPLRRP